MTSKRTWLFDFCDTLVDFQTANAYVEFVMERKGIRRGKIDLLRRMLNRLSLMKVLNRIFTKMSVNKAMLLFQLKGLSYREMDELAEIFYRERICPHFVMPVLEELISAVGNGNMVAVVSGGYDIYLKYFADEYGIPVLLATSLQFRNGIFMGRIQGRDCMGKEKVSRVQSYFHEENIRAVYGDMTGYSDSPSDLPMLNICRDKVVILPDECVPAWALPLKPRIIVRKGGC